jgi:hypothetical protein
MFVFETYPEGTYNERPLPPGRIPNVEPEVDVTPTALVPKIDGYAIVPIYVSTGALGPIAQIA